VAFHPDKECSAVEFVPSPRTKRDHR
jgi:hypothetical protein